MIPCPKCGKGMNVRDNRTQSRSCLACGYIVRGRLEQHLLIQANGKEIAEDWFNMGLMDTLNKWKISTTALYKIPEIREHKGELRNMANEVADKRKLVFKRKPGNNGHIKLPEFNPDWSNEVKMKWLDIFEKLTVGGL